ncbi:MAG: transposase [Proteobacteria bacterium]|nr:transposase [Pseudomonadota bacterium]
MGNLHALRDSGLKAARAWAIKELAMSLWGYASRGWADRMWKRWYNWAIRSRLEPIKKVARMIRRHWQGVINAATSNVTNAVSEGMNSKIQWIKRKACGYRNRERFRNAILFHLGGLDLYPAVLSTHTKS